MRVFSGYGIAAASISLLFTSNALAQPDAGAAFGKCLDQQVVRLLPSGEGAELIARAALYRCNDEFLYFKMSRGSLGTDMEKPALEAAIARVVEAKARQRSVAISKVQSR
jgi:hypothetical protein